MIISMFINIHVLGEFQSNYTVKMEEKMELRTLTIAPRFSVITLICRRSSTVVRVFLNFWSTVSMKQQRSTSWSPMNRDSRKWYGLQFCREYGMRFTHPFPKPPFRHLPIYVFLFSIFILINFLSILIYFCIFVFNFLGLYFFVLYCNNFTKSLWILCVNNIYFLQSKCDICFHFYIDLFFKIC